MLDVVKNIRVQNNDLWIQILRIAMRANPDETKKVLTEINRNDTRVGRGLRYMSRAD